MILNGKETARLRFRNLNENDIETWKHFLRDPLAVKYFGEIADPDEYSKTWIEKQLTRYEEQGHGLYALIDKNTNQFIGQCGILLQDAEGKKYMEVGYHLFPKHWKKGYATEAATFCRDFIFENKMELDGKVVSLIHPENLNSQAVAKRNGMKAGDMTKWKDMPHKIFYITRNEWLHLKNK